MLNTQNLYTYVGKDRVAEIEPLLQNNPEISLDDISFKNPTTAMLLAIFAGFIGLDRYYQGGVRYMLAKWGMLVFTLGMWWIVDILYTPSCVKEENYDKLRARLTA